MVEEALVVAGASDVLDSDCDSDVELVGCDVVEVEDLDEDVVVVDEDEVDVELDEDDVEGGSLVEVDGSAELVAAAVVSDWELDETESVADAAAVVAAVGEVARISLRPPTSSLFSGSTEPVTVAARR